MTQRDRLPDWHASETFDNEVAGLRYKTAVSYFSDRRLAEILLTNGKAGWDVDAAARDSAVVCSITLQYSTPVEVIRRALLRDERGVVSSPLGGGLALELLASKGGER